MGNIGAFCLKPAMAISQQGDCVATLAMDAERPSHIQAMLLLVGMAGTALLSVWIPLLDRQGGGYALKSLDDGRTVASLPSWLVMTALVATVIGGLGLASSLWRDSRLHMALKWCGRWAAGHPWLSLLMIAAVVGGAIDIYELVYDPFVGERGLRPWMLREDLQVWLLLGAALLGGLAISSASPGNGRLTRMAEWLSRSLQGRATGWWVVAIVVPLVLGGAMCALALEGVPHFSDSLTYLMQGRILHSGQLWLPSPKHHELFQHSLFFIETDGRFYGKYPIGWPAIVGTFDRVGIGYAANAVMASLAAVLTGLVASEFTTRRVAVLAALWFGLSPWVWFHGANFASHVSSTCAVMGFLWLFLRSLRTGGGLSAIGAGLALGAGVLIRPFDAAMFALPVIPMVLARQVRDPKRWIPLGTLIAVGALVGVGIYMWANAQTTGGALKSPYSQEDRWSSDWNTTPIGILGKFVFQWSELNGRFPGWGIGGLTLAVMGAIAAGPRWKTTGLRLLMACTVLFFTASAVFGFTNVWWGPRWLLPVVPLLTILAAELTDRVISQLMPALTGQIKDNGASAAAQLAMCVLLAGLVVGLTARYSGQFYQHRLAPPHNVSTAAHRAVLDEGIRHAVIALPPSGDRPPLDARAGMAFMNVPIESNQIIYVRGIADWPQMASECYPDRKLYEIQSDPDSTKGFSIHPARLQ